MRGRGIPVLILAGLLSAALAGLLVILITAILAAGPEGIFGGLYAVLLFGGHAVGAALLVATLPAIALGALLLKAGEARAWPRHWLVWAGAGALLGGASFALCVDIDLLGIGEMAGGATSETRLLLSAFVLAGALSALFFRLIVGIGRSLRVDPD